MATTACSVINADILADCAIKPVGGAEPLLWLIPKADYDAAVKTYNSTNSLVLNSITLPSGKKAFQFLVFRRGHKPRFTTKDSDYGTYYLHEVLTSIQIWNNAVKQQVAGLVDNYYVAIVENVQKSGDAVFEIYGAQNGLRVQDGGVRDLAANEGVFTITLANDADMNEPQIPLSFVVPASGTFSYTQTKAAIVALTTAAS
jgi:hypothetical protein